jgi:hypothetical protein
MSEAGFSFLSAFRLFLGTALVVGCLAASALAQQPRTTPQGIPYLTGGVGSDELAAMAAMAANYNLKLEFARTDGAYLGDVAVTFRGPVSVSLTTDGPVLYIRLPPGVYAVTATTAGATKSQTLTVGASGGKSAAFYW